MKGVVFFAVAFGVPNVVGYLFGRYVISPLLSLVLDDPDGTEDTDDSAAPPGGGVETPTVLEGPGAAAGGEER